MSVQTSDSKILWFRLAVAAILVAWFGLFAYWMYHNLHTVGSYNPPIGGTSGDQQSGESFADYLKFFAVEVFVLLVILRPYSFRPDCWIRSLVALVLCGGWSFLLLLTAMHQSSVYMIHLLALLALDVILFALTLFCIIANLQTNNSYR